MKHLRLQLLSSIAATVLFTASATVLFTHGLWPQATFAAIATLCAIAWTLSLARRLVRLMSTFTKALETNDTTMQFDIFSHDHEIREMSACMNRIIEIYRRNSRNVETAKLYYDRILKVMTHEMRNAVTPIIAISADFERNPKHYDAESLSEGMHVILQQAEGIKKFLDSYYRLTHLGEPDKAMVSAADFIKRVRHLIDAEISGRGLQPEVVTYTVAQSLTLDIDEGLLSQAVVNLARNALDSVAGVENPKVEISALSSADHPTIIISDNGAGISPAIADKLFQPFITTKEDGCGVGLVLSRQIARKHGGDLTLKSNPRGGATARLYLEAHRHSV